MKRLIFFLALITFSRFHLFVMYILSSTANHSEDVYAKVYISLICTSITRWDSLHNTSPGQLEGYLRPCLVEHAAVVPNSWPSWKNKTQQKFLKRSYPLASAGEACSKMASKRQDM